MARAQKLASRFEAVTTLAARARYRVNILSYRAPFMRRLWRAGSGAALFDYPPALKPGNGLRGEAWLAGDYSLVGGVVRGTGQSPFTMSAPGDEWYESLHAFDWLPDLLAVQDGGGAAHARAAILHWAQGPYIGQRRAMQPPLVGRRLARWTHALSVIKDGFDMQDLARITDSFSAQTRWLGLTATQCDDGVERLHTALGLTLAACSLPHESQNLRLGMDLLTRELRRQILPDGGHISRNPHIILGLSADLLALEAKLLNRQIDPPAGLVTARERMLAMLAMLRHGDGRLAVFNGGLEGEPAALNAVLGKTGKPMSFAQKSGYQRLAVGDSCVLVDIGDAPPGSHSRRAHAAPLAFEMSHAGDRLIVNCGPNLVHHADWQLAARGLSAHSTLAFDGDVNDPFLRHGLAARHLGPRLKNQDWQVNCRRVEDKTGIWLETSHAMFLDTHGVRHNRRFFVDADGEDIRGEDLLLADMNHFAAEGAPFHLRFHLHPQVRASVQSGGDAVLLLTASGHGWQFRLGSEATSPVRIEESVYMGRNGVPQRSQQLAVSGQLGHNDTLIRWALRYAGRSGRRS